MVLQGRGRKLSMHWFPCEFFHLLIFSAGLKLILDIFGSSLFCHIFCFARLAFFCRESLVFLASYSCKNLVGLSWPCLMYSQRPTIAASYADSSSTNPHHHFIFWWRVYLHQKLSLFSIFFWISFLNHLTIPKL